MGTSTATNFVNQLNAPSKKLSGVIIAGTVKTAAIDDRVSMPVLAIHHVQDSCPGTLPENSERIISGRPKNMTSRLQMIDGGISEGNICEAFAYHGFNQTEPEFIKRTAQFILNH
jgi:hypothetical protein